ncbi:MAG: hypothetical protein AAGA38_18155 [Pseudomonadota bacterium]
MDDQDSPEPASIEKDWGFWGNDEVVIRSGGLVDPGHLDEFHRMSCGWVRHFYLNAAAAIAREDFGDQIDNLSLFFIDSDERNALALERPDTKGVGIHLGLIRSIWSLLYRGIGGGHLIEVWFDDLAPIQGPVDETMALSDPIWRENEAEGWSADRLQAHHDLFMRAIDFIVYHELAHHVRGHISYLKSEFGMSEIDEALNFSSEPENKRDALRNLEYDADHSALDMMMMSLDRDIEFSTWTETQASREFFLLSLAIIILFQILDEAHSPMSSHYTLSHPAPVHRAMRLTSALSFTFARQFGWSDETREEEHDLAWVAASDVAALLKMPEGRWHGAGSEDMDHDQFVKEEAAFIEFAKVLNALNEAEDS